jgi:hypothetical protein
VLTKAFRDTVLAGLTDQEIAETVGMEMKRRGRIGVMYFFPVEGGNGCFASVAGEHVLELSAAEQLAVFAVHAEKSIDETPIEPSATDEEHFA